MPLLQFDDVSQVAKTLFCVWSNREDYKWFESNYTRFIWYYEDDIELERLKIKLCAIANLYYEFCHEAYGIYQVIPDEIQEIFHDSNLPLSAFRLGQLLGRDYLVDIKRGGEDFNSHQEYLGSCAVISLASALKYQIFEELYTSKNFTPDTLFESFNQIAKLSPDQKGLEYLMNWGDSFSNYS